MGFKKPVAKKRPVMPPQQVARRTRKVASQRRQRQVPTARWVMVVGPTGKKRMVAFPL